MGLRGLIEGLSKFLELVDVVKAYVITNEGLPLLARGVEGVGEDLGYAGEALIKSNNLGRFGVGVDTIVAVGTSDVVIHRAGEGVYATIIAERGSGYAIASTLSRSEGPLRCGACGGELRFAVVVCPKCRAKLPFATVVCPRCGTVIKCRKCPYCGAVINPDGRPAGFMERLSSGPVAPSLPTVPGTSV